jgi:hypothetical protein
MAFDVEGARKAGYTDAEIAGYLAAQNKFDAASARKAGYTDQELIAHLASKVDLVSQIPGQDGKPVPKPAPAKEPTLAEKAIGAGEAALSTITGATTGTAGMVGGAIGGLAGAVMSGDFGTQEGVRRVEQSAAEGAQALTYRPRTESGQDQAAAVGSVMQAAVPLVPLAPQLAQAGQAVRAAAPAASAAGRSTAASAREALRAKVEAAAARRAEAANDASMPTPGTMGSVGAAGTDVATLRRQAGQELPVPVDLTKGQATRNFEQLRFEQEMAKDPTKGAPLRDRFADQNQAILRNFDVWVDDTGAQLRDLPSVGDAVTGALRARAVADKNKTRAAYKAAEKAGEMEAPVTLAEPVRFLNENAPDAVVAPILDAMKARAIRLGVATVDESGELIAQPVPLKTAELWRRAISNATDAEPTNIRFAAEAKRLIDQSTDGLGGDLYRQARQLRRQYAEHYENFGLARDLLNTKRGTNDARIAAEDVFRRSVLTSSMADVRQLGRLLKTSEQGRQAWSEVQGAAVRYIQEQATKNVSRDVRGNEIVSPKGLNDAVNTLDRAGKLDYLFGKKGAEQVRAINDLAKYVYTAPPGAVNTSNTASVILAALDMATSGVAGMPLPVMSGIRILTTHVRDRQIQKRIREALGIKPEPKKVKAPQSVLPAQPTSLRVPENRTIQ